MKEIIVNKNDAGQRLDKFLAKFMPRLPKGMLYKGLRRDCVKINGRHIKSGDYMLLEGDELKLYFKDEFFENGSDFKYTSSDIDIVYEDKNILIINKPSGMVVHSDDKGSADTLIDRVKSYLYKKGEYDPNAEHSFSPALCSRLDRNTEGLVTAAKSAEALREMNRKIRERKIKKLYLCVAEGHPKNSGEISAYLTRGDKIVSVSENAEESSKKIKTGYRVIAENGGESLLEAELFTGRTHQIRASLAYIGHPLAGDKKYGSKAHGKMRLCSYKLCFSADDTPSVLDYLSGKTFSVLPEFAKSFSLQKL